VVPPLIFHQYILFTLCKRGFSAPFETGGRKNVRNKIRKNAISCRTSTAVDPAKRDIERTIIEPTVLNFRPGQTGVPAHHADLMGLMGASFLGTRGSPSQKSPGRYIAGITRRNGCNVLYKPQYGIS
jgi:hypothetical protein